MIAYLRSAWIVLGTLFPWFPFKPKPLPVAPRLSREREDFARILLNLSPETWQHLYADPRAHARRCSDILNDQVIPVLKARGLGPNDRARETTRIAHMLLTGKGSGLVWVNGVLKLINDPVEAVKAWAEFEGIAWNGGEMTLTDDQRFAFRLRFE